MTVLGYVYSQYKDNILLVRICNYCSIHASEIFSGLCTLNPWLLALCFASWLLANFFGLQPKISDSSHCEWYMVHSPGSPSARCDDIEAWTGYQAGSPTQRYNRRFRETLSSSREYRVLESEAPFGEGVLLCSLPQMQALIKQTHGCYS